MEIFDRIKELAKKRDVSMSEVALTLGFSENLFYRWKTTKPKAEDLAKVADYFHVSVDYLLGRDANYTFDGYPFELGVQRLSSGAFLITIFPRQSVPQDFLNTIVDIKLKFERRLNFAPEFNIDDPVWTPFRVEQLFIDELIEKAHIQVIALKNPGEIKPVDIVELANKPKDFDWNTVLSAGGKPITEEDKALIRRLFAHKLSD